MSEIVELTPTFSKEVSEHDVSTKRKGALEVGIKIDSHEEFTMGYKISSGNDFSFGKKNEMYHSANIELIRSGTLANHRRKPKNSAQKSLLSLFESVGLDQMNTDADLGDVTEISFENLVARDAPNTQTKTRTTKCSRPSTNRSLNLKKRFNNSLALREVKASESGFEAGDYDRNEISLSFSSPSTQKNNVSSPQKTFSSTFVMPSPGKSFSMSQSPEKKYASQNDKLTLDEERRDLSTNTQRVESSNQNTQELDLRYSVQQEELADIMDDSSIEIRRNHARIQELCNSPKKRTKVLRVNPNRRKVSRWQLESLLFDNYLSYQIQADSHQNLFESPKSSSQNRRCCFGSDSQNTPN